MFTLRQGYASDLYLINLVCISSSHIRLCGQCMACDAPKKLSGPQGPWTFQRELCSYDSGVGNSKEKVTGTLRGYHQNQSCSLSSPRWVLVLSPRGGLGVLKSQMQILASEHMWGLMGFPLNLPTFPFPLVWGWG